MSDFEKVLNNYKHERFEKYDKNYKNNYAGFIETDDYGDHVRFYKYKLILSPQNVLRCKMVEYLDNYQQK